MQQSGNTSGLVRKRLSKNFTENPRKVMVRPHDFGAIKSGLDLNRMNQTVDDLAVEDYHEKAAKDIQV